MVIRHRLVDPVVRAVSRTRAHRLLGPHLAVIGYTGRRTGRRHELPVVTAPCPGGLVVLVGDADGRPGGGTSRTAPGTSPSGGRQQMSCRARLVHSGDPGREEAASAYRATFHRVAVAPGDPLVVLEPVR